MGAGHAIDRCIGCSTCRRADFFKATMQTNKPQQACRCEIRMLLDSSNKRARLLVCSSSVVGYLFFHAGATLCCPMADCVV